MTLLKVFALLALVHVIVSLIMMCYSIKQANSFDLQSGMWLLSLVVCLVILIIACRLKMNE